LGQCASIRAAQAGRNTARITGVVISATGNERTKQVHECTNGEVVVPRPVVAPKAATPASFTKETRPAGANKGKPPGAAPQPKDEIWADIKSPTAVVERFGMSSLVVGKSLGWSGGERG
jgi:hypothetical protein